MSVSQQIVCEFEGVFFCVVDLVSLFKKTNSFKCCYLVKSLNECNNLSRIVFYYLNPALIHGNERIK